MADPDREGCPPGVASSAPRRHEYRAAGGQVCAELVARAPGLIVEGLTFRFTCAASHKEVTMAKHMVTYSML